MKLKAKQKIVYLLNGKPWRSEARPAPLYVEENYPRKTKKAFRKHIIDFVYNSTGVLYK